MPQTISQVIAKAKSKDCCDSCRKGAKKCPCEADVYNGISKIDMIGKDGSKVAVNLLASVLELADVNASIKDGALIAGGQRFKPTFANGRLQENGINMTLSSYYTLVKAADVAETIIKQIGDNKALFMLGVKNVVRDKNNVTLHLPRNASGANQLKIELRPDDTYTLHFMKYIPSKLELKTLKKMPDILVDNLKSVISKELQMHLSLASSTSY